MSNVQQLLESANPWQSLQSDAARLAKKWGATGLLEGFSHETEKNNMSMILENQAKQLVVEQSQTGTGASFTTGTGEQWAGIALPLVRKVFGQIAAKEFVSVQPMNLPSGLVFFLDFQYGTDKNPFTSGESMYGASSANFGNTSNGALYGAGRFTYSTNQFSASVPTTGSTAGGTAPVVTTGNALITTASFAELNFSSEYSASVAGNKIYKVTVPTSSMGSDFDPLAVRGFLFTSGSLTVSTLLQEFTVLSGGNILFFHSGSVSLVASQGGNGKIEWNKLTKDNARGDFEAGASASIPNSESNTEIVIPQINVQMRSEAIVAKTKKLKAQWTPEFAQDLNAYHSLDAEAELTAVMSEYISLEIDLEILDMLISSAAAGTEYWSAVNNNAINAAGTGFDTNLGFYNTQGQWFQTLGTKMQKLSNIIHQRTLRDFNGK